jgi:hypothetical protein
MVRRALAKLLCGLDANAAADLAIFLFSGDLS